MILKLRKKRVPVPLFLFPKLNFFILLVVNIVKTLSEMDTLIRDEIYVKDNKTFVIKVFRNELEYIAAGTLDGFTINETRQPITIDNKNLDSDNQLINNLIKIIKDDLSDT